MEGRLKNRGEEKESNGFQLEGENELIEHIYNFGKVLKQIYTSSEHFSLKNYEKVISWCSYIEIAVESLGEKEKSEKLNSKISKIKEELELRVPFSLNSLECARHLTLRSFLWKPLIHLSQIELVSRDYFHLQDSNTSCQEVTNMLSQDIYRRLEKKTRVSILFSLVSSILNCWEKWQATQFTILKEKEIAPSDKVCLDYLYPFTSSSLTKKAFAKILISQFQILLTSNQQIQWWEKLTLQLNQNLECFELIYFIGLELIDDANQFVNTDSSIIESRKLLNSWVISLLISNINLSIKLHPWIPTEFSNFHFPFFQSYTSNLIAQWQSKLDINSSNYHQIKSHHEIEKDIQLRFLYLMNRSERLRLYFTQLIQNYENSHSLISFLKIK